MSKPFQNRIPHNWAREHIGKLASSSDLLLTDLNSSVPYNANAFQKAYPAIPVCCLGIIFEKSLTFADHTTQLSRTCYMHIRDFRRPYQQCLTTRPRAK